MKKAYTLFITLSLLLIFSILAKQILEVNSLKYEAIKQEAIYLQAKNHLRFLEEYLISLDLKNIENIKIEDSFFQISARKTPREDAFLLIVESFDYKVRVTKKLFIK